MHESEYVGFWCDAQKFIHGIRDCILKVLVCHIRAGVIILLMSLPSLTKLRRIVSARSETSCCFYYLMRGETWVDGYIHRAKKLQLCRLDKAGAHGIIKQKGTLLPQSDPN